MWAYGSNIRECIGADAIAHKKLLRKIDQQENLQSIGDYAEPQHPRRLSWGKKIDK